MCYFPGQLSRTGRELCRQSIPPPPFQCNFETKENRSGVAQIEGYQKRNIRSGFKVTRLAPDQQITRFFPLVRHPPSPITSSFFPPFPLLFLRFACIFLILASPPSKMQPCESTVHPPKRILVTGGTSGIGKSSLLFSLISTSREIPHPPAGRIRLRHRLHQPPYEILIK